MSTTIEVRPRKAFSEFIATDKRWSCLVVHRRGGKALDVDTPIPMADGSWKRMGDLVDGDKVLGRDGKPCAILQSHPVMHGRNCFEVKFSDGAVIVADEDHLWFTQTKLDRAHRVSRYQQGNGRGGRRPSGTQERRSGSVKATRQIFETLKYAGENNHSVPLAGPAEYPEAELPIDPYILGLWLGDGHSSASYWTTPDAEIEESLRAYAVLAGFSFKELSSQSKSCGNAKVFAITGGGREASMRAILRRMDVFRNKHIPDAYMRGSIAQRKALLAGLMDTDGSIDQSGRKAEITQKKKRIAESIVALLRGLGCKPSINRKIINGEDYWRVSFRPIFNPFRLLRKATRWKAAKVSASSNGRMIVAVREVDSRPVRCITVDSPDSLYLAGDHYIPTHNTYASLQKLLIRAFSDKSTGPPKRYAYIAPTHAQAKDIAWAYLKDFTWQIPGAITNESELKITFGDGMTIKLYSGGNYERMRGLYFHGVIIDEPEDIDPSAWPLVIRPTLTDYNGWAIWIGTLKGKKGQWKRYLEATRDEEWYSMLLRASESGIISDEELAKIRADPGMTEAAYLQEYECDPNIGIPGAIFARYMTEAFQNGRILPFEWERGELVHTFWDLGSPKNTRCTYVQFVGREIHVIDHDHNLEMTPVERVAAMGRRGYYFGTHFLPHDAGAQEKSGKNFAQQLTEAGLEGIRILPRCQEIWPGINKLAEILPRTVFNSTKTEYLVESLENYRTKPEKGEIGAMTDYVVEDWSCHSVDSMRMLAEAMLNGILKGHSEVIREHRPHHQRQKTASAGRYRR